MKRAAAVLIVLYASAFIVDALLADTGNVTARYISKGLLMPLLLAWFIAATKNCITNTNKKYRLYICLALLFSWIGDIFLVGPGSLNFICGIGAFLLAQVFYVTFFFKVRPLYKNNIVFAVVAALIILAYLITLNILMWQKVNEQQLTIPVFAYSIVLGLMLFASINTSNAAKLQNNIAGGFIAGAITFVLSDSMIALNSFYLTKPLPGFYIMLTYCIAQFLIVSNAVRFIKTYNSDPGLSNT